MGKSVIKASVGLSVALVLALVLLVAHFRRSSNMVNRLRPEPSTPATKDASSATSTPFSVGPPKESFRWTQIESVDYKTYVSNLRTIGCPERTLRAIVTADLDSTYGKRAQELERRLSDLKNAPLSVRLGSFNTEQALLTELKRLSAEEEAQISSLLGLDSDSPNPGTGDAASIPVSSARRSARAQSPPQLPLVLQNVDSSALGLDADQRQAIEELRQEFSDSVGGPDQDPSDPSYLARWQKAQPEIDDQLRGILGVDAFERYEMAIDPPPLSSPRPP